MTDANRVLGCTQRTWVHASLDSDGKVQFTAHAESQITRGVGKGHAEGQKQAMSNARPQNATHVAIATETFVWTALEPPDGSPLTPPR